MIRGRFTECDVGNTFHYVETQDEWARKQGTIFEIHFPNTQERRYARILKTVAYIVVDEAPDGGPVFEKWNIKKHEQVVE